MASQAKKDSDVTELGTAEVVPIDAGDRLLPAASEQTFEAHSVLEEYGERAGRLLGGASCSIGCAYSEIQTWLADVSGRIRSRSNRVARNVQYEAQTLMRERPFHLLAAAAIGAFAAGVALRIWRSRS